VHSLLHRFLLMLLILALPLQTFASVGMPGCMVSSQPATERMAVPDAHGGDAAMAAEMMAGCHAHGQSKVPLSPHNCKHCAACALAAALPVPVADSPAIMPVSNRFAPGSAELFIGFIPDGPERPPQPTLA
jgi:hypothetical protein